MSTNSTISIKSGNKVKTIYCHWDGYLANNGEILLKHYKTAKKVNELISLGNISSLKERVTPTVNGLIHKRDENGLRVYDTQHKPVIIETTNPHTFDTPHIDVVVSYGRDRGDTGQEYREYTDCVNESESFDYLFEKGKWYVRCGRTNGKFERLTKQLIRTEFDY
jgi:hypothetical protein